MIKITKAIVPAVVIVVAGVIVALASGVWNPTWNPFKPVSGDIFIDSLTKSLAAKSFGLKASLEINAQAKMGVLSEGGDGQPENVKIGLEADEQIDKSDLENVKANANINLGVAIQGITISGVLEGKAFGDNVYLKIVSFPSFLPLPFDVNQLKDQWIKLNFKDLQDKLAAAGLQMSSGNSDDFQTILKNLQGLTKGKKFFGVKRHWGKEEVSGVMAEHYTVELNKRAVKEFIPTYLELAKKYAPDEQKAQAEQQIADIKEDFDKNFEQYWAALNGLTFEIWVDSSGRLIKFSWQKDIDPSKIGKTQQDIKKMNIRLDFVLSQFDESFEFSEPTEFKTAEEVIGGLAQQLMLATSTPYASSSTGVK